MSKFFITKGNSSRKFEAIKCKPNLFCKFKPANPLKNKPKIEDSKESFLVKNPEISPDKISPVPPTVIEGVVLSIIQILSPSDTMFQYPFKTTIIPYSLAFFITTLI